MKVNKIKYLSRFYKQYLTLEQQIAIGDFHSRLYKSNQRWTKHIRTVGIHVDDIKQPFAIKKHTGHADIQAYTSNSHITWYDRQAQQGTTTTTQRKYMEDKDLSYYIDRYCTNCYSVLIRYSGTSMLCGRCGREYHGV